jgi:hypothetical protein
LQARQQAPEAPEAIEKRRKYGAAYRAKIKARQPSATATADNIFDLPIMFVNNEGNLQDFGEPPKSTNTD